MLFLNVNFIERIGEILEQTLRNLLRVLTIMTLLKSLVVYSSLLDLFNNCQKEPEFHEDGSRFVELIAKLMEILLDYRTVVLGGDNIDNRMSCTVSVLVS